MSGKHELTLEGVIISRAAAGEGSVRVALYTEPLGLIHALVKSAREERSKLRPHLTVGMFGTYTLIRGEHAWRITGAVETKNMYFALSGNQEAQKAAARVLGAVRSLVQGEGADHGVFPALHGFLNALPDTGDVRGAERLALGRILASLGYLSDEVLEGAKDDAHQLTRAINESFSASGLVS